MQADTPFEHTIYIVQSGGLQILRGRCEILDSWGNEILWATLLGFPGSPKIRVYAGRSRRNEALKINRPRTYGPMSENHDYAVLDPTNNFSIGAVRLTNDGWMLLNKSHEKTICFKQVGQSADELRPKVMLQRANLPIILEGIPAQVWDGYTDDEHVCQVVKWHSKIRTIPVDCSLDAKGTLYKRLALSSALVQLAIEAEQYQVMM
jgi:hypothetical protein